MSKAGRLGLIALAVAVAVVAFVVARPGDDDGGGQSTTTSTATGTAPTATARSAPPPPPDSPGRKKPVQIELRGHEAVGGVSSIEVEKGEQVRFGVSSDEPDQIHVHGYDLEQPVGPGEPASFSFPATIEGVFEIESHEAEHAGKPALIARLVVEPS